MKFVQSNIVVVMLMLMTFIGQAMASTAMPCAHVSMDMPMMNHEEMSNTDAMSVMDDEASMMDCCQDQCQCPMSGCVSLFVLINNHVSHSDKAEQGIYQIPLLHPSQVSSSLYRPPIL